jgi:hypothetical protein
VQPLPSEISTCPNCNGALSAEEVQSAPLRCPHCNELLLPKFPRWYERLRLAVCLIAGIAIPLWRHPDWGSFVIFVVGFYWLGAFGVWHIVVRPFMRPKQICLCHNVPSFKPLASARFGERNNRDCREILVSYRQVRRRGASECEQSVVRRRTCDRRIWKKAAGVCGGCGGL